MTAPLLGTLAVLALVDSASFGTLLIPIWLMLAPGRLRPGRILVFLVTVAAFYWAVGLLLLAGADTLMTALDQDSPVLTYAQLVLGAVLFVGAFFVGREPKDGSSPAPGRFSRWRERTVSAEGRGGLPALMGLALGAATLEVATMLPYLGAVGMLTAADLPVAQRVLLLTGYCAVMVLPALLLLGARIAARRLIEPLLIRVSAWMAKSSGETIAWVMGIAGFLLLRDAASRIGLLESIGISIG
ncbi:GAP family protein [Ruania alkalisoli]|uniref:GAP family protein n=1 Tax=Ruania alkalisoli TaxID=2779775 RepID=A0A7M1SU33_9MICO|nr:GAP family protein [Ruania alkalisoli]QOR71090.1 GAP family protein [Ruania alkalisoli]